MEIYEWKVVLSDQIKENAFKVNYDTLLKHSDKKSFWDGTVNDCITRKIGYGTE